MPTPTRYPRRKPIRLPSEVYATPGLPFLITFNVRPGSPVVLTRAPVAEVLRSTFERATVAVPCSVFAWCVMPDHVHVVIATLAGGSVQRWVQAYKSLTATALRSFGVWSLWQRSFNDRAIRDGDVRRAALYALCNPVRAGLVETWSDWPHHGSLEWDLWAWD